MTLLRLSPDSERLRRIAKAHAAGELSTPDYRRIRAEVIERFSSGEAEQFDDDTQPRWLDRPIPAAQPSPAPVPTDVPPPARRRLWLWALVVSVIVIAAVGSAGAWSSTIPQVKQRDPNPATGPRIPVAFRASSARQFDAQMRFSVPVADKGSQDWINDNGVTLYWMLRYVL